MTHPCTTQGFRCSKVKRHCYEPCDEGREAVTKPANVELDSAQATLWSSLNGTRMEYWDFTDGAVLDDVDPRNECSGLAFLGTIAGAFAHRRRFFLRDVWTRLD